jgi:hypothetical protein
MRYNEEFRNKHSSAVSSTKMKWLELVQSTRGMRKSDIILIRKPKSVQCAAPFSIRFRCFSLQYRQANAGVIL